MHICRGCNRDGRRCFQRRLCLRSGRRYESCTCGSWDGSPRGEFCARCEKKVDPDWLSEDGRVNGFDESTWPARQEVAVRVELRIHIRIQLPAWSEVQRPLPGNDDTQETKSQNKRDNEPVASLLLRSFHGFIQLIGNRTKTVVPG